MPFSLSKTLFAALFVSAIATVHADAAIVLTPNLAVTNGTIEGTGNFNPKADDIEGYLDLDFDLTECFKEDAPSTRSGAFASSYDVVWDNPSDPESGTVKYISGPKILDALYLLVKDGNHADYWYVFDISTWDGMEDIQLNAFWPRGGAISHVTIFCGPRTTTEIPTPAALPAGLALIGLAAMRRRRAA